jgi:hypothetical protein
MARISPTAEGYRAAWRRPSLTFAEITWRWVVGATAATLLLFSIIEYLRTLPVNNSELLFLKTRQPVLVGQAIAHILRGSAVRAVLTTLLGAIALAGLWIVAASLGRIATVRALQKYFATRKKASGDPSADSVETRNPETRPSPLRGSFDLNFLRVAVVIAAVLGLVGASILAGFASPDADPQPGLYFLLFLPMAALVCFLGFLLNWFLSLAAVFTVRDGSRAILAMSSAASFWRDRPGPVFAVTLWKAMAHVAVFIGASTVAFISLGLISVLPGRLVLAFILVVSLAYFAVVDWLYTARLAGYLCILEMPEEEVAPTPPAPLALAPVEMSIDRDEPILSDIPPFAIPT